MGPDFEPWANKRVEILARYTTTEKLSIVSTQLHVSQPASSRALEFLSCVSVICVPIGFLNGNMLRVRGAAQFRKGIGSMGPLGRAPTKASN